MDLIPERRHYYRLNALVNDRWIEVGRGSFDTWTCIVLESVSCRGGPMPAARFVRLHPSIVEHAGNPVAIWVDLSLFDNGFAPNTFIGAGPFSPTLAEQDATHDWTMLLPNRRHYYRMNVLWSIGWWVNTYQGAFTTPDCEHLPRQFAHIPLD